MNLAVEVLEDEVYDLAAILDGELGCGDVVPQSCYFAAVNTVAGTTGLPLGIYSGIGIMMLESFLNIPSAGGTY